MIEQHHFGRAVLRPAQRQLLIDGVPAVIGSRAFDLLLALVAHRERMVSKSELLDLVWPGLVVEENNLQVHVSALRKLLGPQAIATIPGRGYRFTLASGSDPGVGAMGQADGQMPHPWLSRPPVPALPALVSSATPSLQTAAPVSAANGPPSPDPSPGPLWRGHTVALHGRAADLEALQQALEQHALVTLLGAGGIGKTTLARAAAQAHHDAHPAQIAWVELAGLADARLIAGVVAQALALQLAPGPDALEALIAALKPMQLLLVLDNAEHLLDGVAALVQALQQGTPGVRVLVTSQIALRVPQEQVLRLPALAVPPSASPLAQARELGAVQLFVERARLADRRFELNEANLDAVIDICTRLDGMPLALELAAARVALLGVHGVSARLGDRFKLLSSSVRTAPSRQQTLQAALDWSLSLLPETERVVFRRLGVFAGGFTLGLAQALLGPQPAAPATLAMTPPHEARLATIADFDEWALIDALTVLVDHSLLAVSATDPPRYALSETARAYALMQLNLQRESDLLQARHAHAVRRFFDAAPADWLHLSDALWLARYEPEIDNLRAALAWAHSHHAPTLLALIGSAAPLWHHLSLHAEARRWHELSEALIDTELPAPVAAAWWRAAQWAWAEVAPERSQKAAEHAQALYRALGDAHGLFAQLTGQAGLWREPHPQAQAALQEALSLERPDWPARERAWGQRAQADVARAEGRLADSRKARQAELALRVQAGDLRGQLRAQAHLADLALVLGDAEEAERLGRDLVARLQHQHAPATLEIALRGLAAALRARGRHDEAEALEPPAVPRPASA